MNNYSNMNFYMPDDYAFLAQKKQTGMQPNQSKPMPNQKPSDGNAKLKQKLAVQAGDNMNFNKCDYNQQIDPKNMYDVYSGFIRGNMFPDLFNQYKLIKPYDIEPMNEQAQLLTYIDAYGFAAHDLNLYLDNNPNDRDMIKLFAEYTDQTNKLITEYESKYGPLFVDASTTYPWAWNNTPWPWENK